MRYLGRDRIFSGVDFAPPSVHQNDTKLPDWRGQKVAKRLSNRSENIAGVGIARHTALVDYRVSDFAYGLQAIADYLREDSRFHKSFNSLWSGQPVELATRGEA